MTFDWNVVVRHADLLLLGFGVTLLAVVLAFTFGSLVGLVVCLGSRASGRLPQLLARTYVNLFRNIPEALLIFWAYFCLPQLLPLKLSGFATGVLALTISAGAYLGEIFRAGVAGVPDGQWEAGRALGLSRAALWRCVILPQAVARTTPMLVNYSTELLKFSALLSTVGVAELVHTATTLGGQNFRYLELYSTVALIFFGTIFPLSIYARHRGGRRLSTQS
jgi:polar amino acid transport system permease protein